MDERVLSSLLKHWDKLVGQGQVLTFHTGQFLFYEGHDPYGIFVLLRGRLAFTKDGLPSRDDHIAHFPKGDLISLESFFAQNPYCCSCVTTEDSWVLFISKTQLFPFFRTQLKGGES